MTTTKTSGGTDHDVVAAIEQDMRTRKRPRRRRPTAAKDEGDAMLAGAGNRSCEGNRYLVLGPLGAKQIHGDGYERHLKDLEKEK